MIERETEAAGCVIVAGGAGFIGSALVRALVEDGHRVVVIDDFSVGSRANLAEIEAAIEIVTCDVADADALARAMLRIRPTHVVSCIGDTYVPACYAFPERFFRINLTAHLNLLQACRNPEIRRLLYLSSAEVYGSQPSVALSEQAPIGAANTYAVSKLAADQLMLTFACEHDVPTLVARIFNCYGPRETHAYIVPELIEQLSVSNRLVLGDTSAVRDLTFVEDTARALKRLLFVPAPPATVVNVGSGNRTSVAELAERLGRLMGHAAISIEVDPEKFRRNDIPAIRCDNSALRVLTGWRPAIDLDEGLARTIAWYRGNGGRWPWRSHDDETSTHAEVAQLHRA